MSIRRVYMAVLLLFLVKAATAQKKWITCTLPPVTKFTVLMKFNAHVRDAECGVNAWGRKYEVDGIDVFQKVGEEKYIELATSCDYYPFEEGRLYYVTFEERTDHEGQKRNYIEKAEPVVAYLQKQSKSAKLSTKKFYSMGDVPNK